MTEMTASPKNVTSVLVAPAITSAEPRAEAAFAVIGSKSRAPEAAESGRQLQFGMTFEEQQEVIYQALMAFQVPDPQ